ncbi:MAG: hypothetical protein M3134_06730 [Actinomycetota bacterium]|nr:hypothetical protein [Actinomycetota bacterium]
MTDMTVVPAVSDTPPGDTPSPIAPVEYVSARCLARNTAAILRAVADDGHAFAIRHFGRVVGFLVPVEGRVPVMQRGKVIYEVPERQPLAELNDVEAWVVGTLYRLGKAVADQLVGDHPVGDALIALGKLEFDPPLLRKTRFGYELTAEGERHAEELGL